MRTKADHPPTTSTAMDTSPIALGAAQRLANQYMTKHELAAVLGKAPKTIDRWVQARTCPPFVRTGKTIRFHIDSVTEWLKHNEVRIEANARRRA